MEHRSSSPTSSIVPLTATPYHVSAHCQSDRLLVDDALLEAAQKLPAVQITADQYEPALDRPDPIAFVEREPLADQVKYVRFFALIDADQAFGAEHVLRQPFEELLKSFRSEGAIGLE